MVKKLIIHLLTFLMLLATGLTAVAHPGKTDADGGHNDYVHGGYHYHHGYSAHQHPNGVCPYEENDDERYDCGVDGCEIEGEHGHILKDKEEVDVQEEVKKERPKWKNWIGLVIFSVFPAYVVVGSIVLSIKEKKKR